MLKLLKIAFMIFFILTILLILMYNFFLFKSYNYNTDFLRIDSCLDSGGCWDYMDRICRKDEINAQALCYRCRQ